MRLLPLLSSLILLVACEVPAEVPVQDDLEDTAVEEQVATNPYGDAQDLACPVFQDGGNTLNSGGGERQVKLVLPDDPEGAPVVFAWHWLGGSADQILSWMDMASLAEQGAIVVAPDSTRMASEWDYLADPDQSVDVQLFDELLVCLWDQYQVDADRIYATGMSAGGLFTSYLTMHRAPVLAATAPFSGGVTRAYYSSPESALPVMLSWGGPDDGYGGYNFHQATLSMSESLRGDGSFVVECEHELGHLPPPESAQMAWTFFESHPLTLQEEPWREALPADLPGYCRLP